MRNYYLLLTVCSCTLVKSKVTISQKFMPFSEYMYALYLVFSSGRQSLMWCIRSRLRVLAKNGVPFLVANVGYFLCRKEASSFSWSTIFLLSLMSCCDRFMTPIIPNFTGTTRPHKISIASVPTKKSWKNFRK